MTDCDRCEKECPDCHCKQKLKIKWISCSERLPPKGKWVIVCYKNGTDTMIVKRKGWFKPFWAHRSGIMGDYITSQHQWVDND